MRYHPSVRFIEECHLPKEGAVIYRTKIRGSTIVDINSWVVHRGKTVFGNDVDEFGLSDGWKRTSRSFKLWTGISWRSVRAFGF